MLFIVILSLFSFPTVAGSCGASCAKNDAAKHPQLQARYPQVLVFASFSLPMEALKTLATQVNAVGGAVVFRGLVDGSFKKTALKPKELDREVLIDPTLFDAYNVKTVPTFVLRKSTTEAAATNIPYDRLSGHVCLTYVLEQFAGQGEVQDTASKLLQKLKTTQ